MTKFYAIVTNLGAAKIANAVSLGTKLNITHMAVGDGGGVSPTPNAGQTKLVNEVRRAALNSLTVDAANSSQIIAEQIIPETEGGFWIREMGLFDGDGTLIAVCNTADTYKPLLQEGSGRTQRLRMIIVVSSTDAITLKIDPSVVLATRQYTDEKVLEVRQYADNLLSGHLKASDPHMQYAPKASPTLTGLPKAPTAAAGNSSTQIATTEFVAAALASLAGGAPAALDTLKELADALGGDANFSTTVLNKLAGKMDIAKNGTDIADVSAFLKSLGLGDGSALPVGIPVPWPSATPPTGWLKCNGAAFGAADYPQLAKLFTTLKLPDLRGEFIRGWDDGRGVDSGRSLLSSQEATGVAVTLGGFSGYNGIDIEDFEVGKSHPSYAVYTAQTTQSSLGTTYRKVRPRNIAFNYIVRAA
jgi:phage-related tail fiber protein